MSSRNISINDTEFERGRANQNDSSSSRESSPAVKRKRQLTPPSDDESDVLPATAPDDDTPPPERPIVREGVAFSWDPSKSIAPVTTKINTYQPTLQPQSTQTTDIYLPGQNPLGKKVKKKRERRVTAYSSQTTRFRLEAYDPGLKLVTDVSQPPLQHGQGPYNSLYRANKTANATERASGSSNASTRQSTPRTTNKRSRVTGPSTTTTNVSPDFLQSNILTLPGSVYYPLEHSGQTQTFQTNNLNNNLNYYQHDLGEGRAVTSTENQIQEPPTFPEHNEPGTSNLPSTTLPRNHYSEQSEIGSSSPAKRPGFNNRMITILIHDIRSGRTDRQLAEVTIPVKMADDPQDGFWADAKDISEKLQSSPSRIDGPARVYTLRGKYRQIFLRVSSENHDNYNSANIGISPDRTLDVVVEKPPQPGHYPSSPKIPTELLPPSPEEDDTSLSDVSSGVDDPSNRLVPVQKSKKWGVQKRQPSHSPSIDSSDEEVETRGEKRGNTMMVRKKPRKRSREVTSISVLDRLPSFKKRNNPIGVRTLTQMSFDQTRGYDSPTSDADPSTLHDMIVRAVEIIIQKQPQWSYLASWRMSSLPNMLKAYEFIQHMMDELVGEIAPFRSKTHEIRKSHVLTALRVEPKLGSDCTETLKLLGLYGEKGIRCQDSRVVEMINRQEPQKPNVKPHKQLLRLLRSINTEWEKEHGEDS
ncbi:hypothetical protein AMATHDRAFT_3549 [Amanita thiersii Skay4041]|uniref:Uncharacterized protein n=1 Tax=Amanita thiersii Skay4041 TaxID=703135 RepID=A0A2A9NTD7_9AGAR|nr:hypothetical protein AMATHDRAFT_3549 [Amanita thiersii Skay4041]